jgi:hypothetical protein
MNVDIADKESLASLNRFHATQTLAKCLGEAALQSAEGRLGDVKRSLPDAEHLREAVAMIGMFVSD